jgi:hypothetical protein
MGAYGARGPDGARGWCSGQWPAALLLAMIATVLVSGCNYNVIAQSQGPSQPSTGTGPGIATAYPLDPTPWPNGTTGAYGLRIDPNLLSNIPAIVGGNPLQEEVAIESAALDDAHYAAAFNSYYVAGIGSITDLNWIQVSLAALKADANTEDFYTSWRDDWFKASCSQADGIATTSVQSINDWQVDVATCNGGVDAYTLSLDNGVLLSIIDFGPRRLGKQLIQGIN